MAATESNDAIAIRKIRGFVVDANSGRPLKRALVSLRGRSESGADLLYTTLISDDNGYVSFDASHADTQLLKELWIESPGGEKVGLSDRKPDTFGAMTFSLKTSANPSGQVLHGPPPPVWASIQDPDVRDWDNSLATFASSPRMHWGESPECQVPIPGNQAGRPFPQNAR